MSSKKDKLLESAQKFIAKGQLDRAIKDYEQIAALDSGDIRHRQRLAELLVRASRREEAIAQYEAIGKYYSDHAFFLKAIAVYKQIQKLDPGNVSITLNLASLNERQGLIGNALAEYNNALSYYQKTRQLPEAIKVLDQMLAADPDNLNTLLKFAETYYSAGVHEKSYDQFIRLAVHLGKSGDESALKQICNRIASLFPDRKDFLLELTSTLIEEGDVGAAIRHLLVMTENDNGNRRAWELLVEAYKSQGDHERCSATLHRMVSLFPEEPSFREKLSKDIHDAGPEKSAEEEVSPEAGSPEEAFVPESSPAASEGSIAAPPETDDSGLPWEEEIDLDLADEPGVFEPTPDADGSPVGLIPETADEEPPRAGSTMAGREGSSLERPSLPDDFSEIDMELDAEDAADTVAVSAQTEGAGETALVDGFGEINLEVDERAAADSFGPGLQGVDVAALPLITDFSEIDLETATDEIADGSVSESEDADVGELLPLMEDVSEIDLEIEEDEAAEGSGFAGTMEAEIEESFPLDDDSRIDLELELDAEDVTDGDATDLDGTYTGESSLLDEVSELDLEADGEETHLSLDDLLAEPSAEAFSDIAALESEQATQMPELGEGTVESFDLGAELRQEEFASPDSAESSKYSLDGLFSAFKEVVDQQLDQGDTETHYNLGIAYREMGLYDDAIAEFQVASLAAKRTADCLTLQGICHRDKGDVASAEAAFRTGMVLEGLSREEALSLKYELALLLEGSGRMEESVQLYREVRAADPGFREVGSRIAAIDGDEETAEAEELELLELEEEE